MALAMLASDFIVDSLIRLGVRHVFGVGGANIEDMFSAVQRHRPDIQAVLCKHEHAAGTAADACARLRGLGVVMTTSGGGAMNLLHSMAEARASRAPVLAIVGEPPTSLQGKGAFQDTSGRGGAVDAFAVFQAVTGRCFRVNDAEQLARLVNKALDEVTGDEPGPAVLLIAKDLQRANLAGDVRFRARVATVRGSAPNADDWARARSWVELRPVVILAGSEVVRRNAVGELASLAEALDAQVATTPDARDAFDNRNARFVGVSGAMGDAAVPRAIRDARLVIAVGTRLPVLAREGLEEPLREKKLLSVGSDRSFVSAAATVHLPGDLSTTLRALGGRHAALSPLRPARPRRDTLAALAPESLQVAPVASRPLTVAAVVRSIERFLPEDGVVLLDAGNTGAAAMHHLRAPHGGRWLVAMGMAGMGYTFGAATGAAFTTGKRCIVIAGDGAFFMHGLEIHTAVEHSLPITYVILNNRAHGMCLVRERLLLGENGGYNGFRPSHIGAGLAAMFPGLCAADCRTESEFERLLAVSMAKLGPSVLCAELDEVEVPPFSAFQERAPSTVTVPREVPHA
jgi:acetolactate synthase-1/2/3 large subunit